MPWEKQFDVDVMLERAMESFWTHGYQGTSVQDLVRSTGVNRGSLYSVYPDKHALFLAALRMYDDEMRTRRLAELEARYASKEAIRQLFLAFASSAVEDGENRGCFLTNTALELAAHDAKARKIVAGAQKAIEAFLLRMVEQGVQRREIDAASRPSELASGLLASLIGLTVLTRSRPERQLLRAVVDDAMRRLR